MVASIARRTCLVALTTGMLASACPALAQPGLGNRAEERRLTSSSCATAPPIRTQADTDPLNLANVTQAAAAQLTPGPGQGEGNCATMKKLGIPVGQGDTSQYFRAIETGRLLGFGEPQTTADVSRGRPGRDADREQPADPRRCASSPPRRFPAPKSVVVSHKPNILDAFGKDWFDVREGEISIFKPDGSGGYLLVARVQADEWAKLAQ
jgi:hypothetical protein